MAEGGPVSRSPPCPSRRLRIPHNATVVFASAAAAVFAPSLSEAKPEVLDPGLPYGTWMVIGFLTVIVALWVCCVLSVLLFACTIVFQHVRQYTLVRTALRSWRLGQMANEPHKLLYTVTCGWWPLYDRHAVRLMDEDGGGDGDRESVEEDTRTIGSFAGAVSFNGEAATHLGEDSRSQTDTNTAPGHDDPPTHADDTHESSDDEDDMGSSADVEDRGEEAPHRDDFDAEGKPV